MKKIKVCRCPIPNCEKSVDITDWDMIDSQLCNCCCEQFEWEDVDKSTVKYIDKTW